MRPLRPPERGRYVPRLTLYLAAFLFYIVAVGRTFVITGGGATAVVITARGQEFAVMRLPATTTLAVPGALGKTVVEVAGRRARVVSSPCPNKLCVARGWLQAKGDYALCLPNGVAVRLE